MRMRLMVFICGLFLLLSACKSDNIEVISSPSESSRPLELTIESNVASTPESKNSPSPVLNEDTFVNDPNLPEIQERHFDYVELIHISTSEHPTQVRVGDMFMGMEVVYLRHIEAAYPYRPDEWEKSVVSVQLEGEMILRGKLTYDPYSDFMPHVIWFTLDESEFAKLPLDVDGLIHLGLYSVRNSEDILEKIDLHENGFEVEGEANISLLSLVYIAASSATSSLDISHFEILP